MLRRTEEVLHRKSIGFMYLGNDLTTLVFLQLDADHTTRSQALISSKTGHNQTVLLLSYLALEDIGSRAREYENTLEDGPGGEIASGS